MYSSDLVKTPVVGEDEILLLPTDHEGLAALVRQKPTDDWKRERLGRGEWLFSL
jgi:hypothetical protein